MSKKIMKRSLALGALMAFVITGSAMSVAEAKYVEGEGNKLVIETQEAGKTRVVGGWSGADSSVLKENYKGDVTVNAGTWEYVMGGSYLSELNGLADMSIASTEVVINPLANVQQVVGGTGGNSIATFKVNNDRTAHLIINGGSFGKESDWVGNKALNSLVVGGDHIKGDATYVSWKQNCDISLDSAKTEIKGGTFNSLIIGGSLANQYNAKIGSGVLKTYVGKAETIITGGTFYKPIVAGGVAKGGEAISNVGEAILSISNATVNSDVYAAGMVCYGDTNGTEGASVEKSTVTIKDSKVGNVYNTRGYFYNSDGWKFWAEDEAPEGSSAGSSAEGYLDASVTKLALVNASVEKVDIVNVEDSTENSSIELRVEGEGKTTVGELVSNDVDVTISADGEVNDAYAGDVKAMIADRFNVKNETGEDALMDDNGNVDSDIVKEATMEEGEVMGAATLNSDGTVTTAAHQGNTGIKDIVATGLISWRYEMNDMNKRMGELRNANGEHGVWVRMVRGETEYNSVKNQYNQYQLGYDEKLSVDPSWTVGVALSYTEADNNFSKGTGESTNKALSIYGSKLNDDGTFIDLIAKYARLENDFDLGTAKGDYDTNGYSFSAEYGKRIQQGNGLWIEPQVELTYGQVDGATYMVGGRTVNQDNMESLIGRVGFSLGKDISKGNVYARASYLYDFEGETSATFSKGIATDSFEQDLGGGWWEVGVGANINLSKATYIYADIEKTFGGEVDTNWQWNLGVRYSF